MTKAKLIAAAIPLILATSALYGEGGTGSDVVEFAPELGLNIVEISVNGNRDEVGPANFIVSCTGVSEEDSLVVNEVASSWSGRSLVRVESPQVLCEVAAVQQARWQISFVSRSSSPGTPDGPPRDEGHSTPRRQGTSQPTQVPLPMSEYVNLPSNPSDWEFACTPDQLTGEASSCRLSSPGYWSVGESNNQTRAIGAVFAFCSENLLILGGGGESRITRMALGGSEPFATRAGVLEVDPTWSENEIAFETVDDFGVTKVWRVPPPRGEQADDFAAACRALQAP